jgi:hypothetical protein
MKFKCDRLILTSVLLTVNIQAQVMRKECKEQNRVSQIQSQLHNRAVAIGGTLKESREIQINQPLNINEMTTHSELIALVHVIKVSAIIDASGENIYTRYDAVILSALKGSTTKNNVLHIIIPGGAFLFQDGVHAKQSIKGLHNMKDGGRYLWLLSEAPPNVESTCEKPYALAGEEMDGAFEVSNGNIMPVYDYSALTPAGKMITLTQLLSKLQLNEK